MVRYLFYTIGDLTYQSPLVVGPIDVFSKRQVENSWTTLSRDHCRVGKQWIMGLL